MADGADYDSLLPTGTQAAPVAVASSPAPVEPAGADYDSLLPLQTQTAKGEAPIPGGSVSEKPAFYGYVEKLGKHFQRGSGEIGSDLNSFVTLGLGNRSIEDFNKEDAARQQFASSLTKEDELDYHLKPAMDNALRPLGQTVSNVLAESAPSLGAGAAGMAVAGAAAALIGAPIVIPALAGGAAVAGVIGAGSMIRELREHGADPTIARIGGVVAGAANAATMFIGGGVTGKVIKDVVIKTGVKAVLIDLAKSMGINAEAMGLNNLTDAIVRLVAAKHGAGKYTQEEIDNEFKQGIGTTLIAAPALTIGGVAAGKILGTALKPLMKNEEALAALAKYFNKRSDQIEAENFVKLHETYFGKVEKMTTETVHGEVMKEKGESAAGAQMKLGETAFDAAARKIRDIKQNVDIIQEQVTNQRKKIFDLEAQVEEPANPTIAEEAGAELPGAHQKLLDLQQELQVATAERDKVLAENEVVAQQEQEKEQSAQQTQQVKEAEERNVQFRDALERKNLIDKAILAASLKKGAGKEILKAEKASMGKPLTQVQEEVLKEKIELPRSPDEVFNLAAEVTENLASHLPTSKTSGMSGMSLKLQLNTLFQYLPPAEGKRLAAIFDASKAVDHRDIILTNLTNLLYGFVEESTGLSRKEVERLAVKAQKQELTITATGADNKPHTVTISAGKMQAYLALMENAKALEALTDTKEGNNFTTRKMHGAQSTQAAFELALEKANPDYNKMIPGIARFYEEVGPEVKAFHDERNPEAPLNLEKNYGQQVRRESANEPSQKGLIPETPGMDIEPGESKGTGKGEAKPPGVVKPRAGLKGRIVAHDAFQSAQNHAHIVANYFAYTDPSKLWAELLANTEFRHYATSNFGKQALSTLEDSYNYVVHGSQEPRTGMEQIFNFLLNAKAVRTLTGNVLYIPKHALTAANGLLYEYNGEKLPAPLLLRAALDLMLHPNKATEIINRPEVNIRYTRKDYLATATGAGGKTSKLIGVMITPGDKMAVATIVHAVEDFVTRRTDDPELAREEANRAPEEVLAASSAAKTTPTTRHLLLRLLTQFSGPEAVVAAHVRNQWRIAANHPTRANLVNAFYTDFIGRTALVLFALPSVMYAYGVGIATGNKKKIAEAGAQVLNKGIVGAQFGMPGLFVPSIATITANRVFGTDFYVAEHGVPGLESVTELDEASAEAKKMIEGKKEQSFHNIMDVMIKAIDASDLPVPLPQARGLKDLTYTPPKPR